MTSPVVLDTSTELFETHSGDDSSSSPSMRLNGSAGSSASVASRLYHGRAGGNSGHSRRGSFGSSEPDNELISFSDSEPQHNDYNSLSMQVSIMRQKLSDMEESRTATLDERARLKMENAVLNERISVLEEQFMTNEQRYEERLEEERTRHKEACMRNEREKQLEMESASLKYQVLEKDLEQQRAERERRAAETAKLQAEVDKLRDKLAESELLREDLEEERIKLDREFRKYKETAQQDIDSSSELVEELSRQADLARLHPARQGSIADQLSMAEEELLRMRDECRELKRANEEMQSQILHDSFEKGRSLLEDGAGTSLMDELAGKDTTELIEALREQEVCNQKLRAYINGILGRVIERYPEILEIPCGEPNDAHSNGTSS